MLDIWQEVDEGVGAGSDKSFVEVLFGDIFGDVYFCLSIKGSGIHGFVELHDGDAGGGVVV